MRFPCHALMGINVAVVVLTGQRSLIAQDTTAFRILRAGRGFVWAVELDDLDVPYVVRYQVKWQQ